MRIFILRIIATFTPCYCFSFSLGFFLLSAGFVDAQSANGFIKGRVLDGSSGRSLPGVVIRKEGGAGNTFTAVDGRKLYTAIEKRKANPHL
jgi:hypothetical protein